MGGGVSNDGSEYHYQYIYLLLVPVALSRFGVDELMLRIGRQVEREKTAEEVRKKEKVKQPDAESLSPIVAANGEVESSFSIFKDTTTNPPTYRLRGRLVETKVLMADMSSTKGQKRMRDSLDSLGVSRALARSGLPSGASVEVGGWIFEYNPLVGLNTNPHNFTTP